MWVRGVPRRGQVKEKRGDRLVDRVGLEVLAAQFPDALVDEVVAETGRRGRRTRDLPAALTVRYVVALALFPSDGYDEVMRQVKVADDWRSDRAGPVKVPAATAITKARDRLGVEPVKLPFEKPPANRPCSPTCWARYVWACWCWPTATSSVSTCSRRRPRPARTCCGGRSPTGACPSTPRPDRVEQEVWGILLLHRALRKLIHDTALREGVDPDRLSFTHTVSIVRRQIVRRAIFPPPPDRPDPRSGDR